MSVAVPLQRVHSTELLKASKVIRVSGLNHWYKDSAAPVLSDVHLQVAQGEIVIMTGPSGSGKTTLLSILGALRGAQQGEVEVLGRRLHELRGNELVEVRRDIGFIFQAHNLFNSLTALQNVRMALELQSSDRKQNHDRAVEALKRLGFKDELEDRINYKPSHLSGGQKQRVAIARALANRPKLILADEPTAALDEKTGRTVVELFKELARQQGCTILIVTHDNRILDVADRIVSMVEGRIKSNVLVQELIEICEFLKQCEAFPRLETSLLTNYSRLTTSALAKIAEEMKRESYEAGTLLIRQGDEGDKFYLIKQGVVDVIESQGQPNEKKVATLSRGQVFGERSLLTGQPRNASVIATQDVELYTLDKPHFDSAIKASEPFRKELEKILFQRQ
ncbi:MAG: ATP-binding cassette domain-containing protein [Gemmataceae bacterium]